MDDDEVVTFDDEPIEELDSSMSAMDEDDDEVVSFGSDATPSDSIPTPLVTEDDDEVVNFDEDPTTSVTPESGASDVEAQTDEVGNDSLLARGYALGDAQLATSIEAAGPVVPGQPEPTLHVFEDGTFEITVSGKTTQYDTEGTETVFNPDAPSKNEGIIKALNDSVTEEHALPEDERRALIAKERATTEKEILDSNAFKSGERRLTVGDNMGNFVMTNHPEWSSWGGEFLLRDVAQYAQGLLVEGVLNVQDATREAIVNKYEEDPEAFKETIAALNTVLNIPANDGESAYRALATGIGSMMEWSEAFGVTAGSEVVGGIAMSAAAKAAKATARGVSGVIKKVMPRPNAGPRLNANFIKGHEIENNKAAEEAASTTANANKELRTQMILDMQKATGKVISKKDKDGNLTIDEDATRQAGNDIMEERAAGDILDAIPEDADMKLVRDQTDTLLAPILRPHKLDALVAITKGLQDAFPEHFGMKPKTKKVTVPTKDGKSTKVVTSKSGPDKPKIIDALVDLAVDKKILESPEFKAELLKYGLNTEEFILATVGSGSNAGKLLNKLSQIRKSRPRNEVEDAAAKARNAENSAFRNGVMRLEGVRRGGLVSKIATAARNLTSIGVRLPLESLANVMDTAIVAGQKTGGARGLLEGTATAFKPSNWKGSFRGMQYVFQDGANVKDVVDTLTAHPKLANQWSLLFDNLNEIHMSQGKGTGTKFDKTMTEIENVVDTLNIPNRWQEHLVRRGVFLSELERLVKQRYDLDFIDEVTNKGNFNKLLEDGLTPEGQVSFMDTVADATNKALDVTYAKAPDIPVFKSVSQFIVRNGLTVAVPFPRFMFNAMELMGQYAGGASIPLSRKVASLVTGGKVGKGPLTAKDRQRITRNLMGVAAAGAAYSYRTSEGAPANFYEVEAGEGKVSDVRPLYPVPQFMFVGEAAKRMKDGTFGDWFDAKKFVETFTGTNFRSGQGNAILDEIAKIAEGSDLTAEESAGKATGSLLGNYLTTWLIPFTQLIDAQKATGQRSGESKDVAEDPTLDFTESFKKGLMAPIDRTGITRTAEEWNAEKDRIFITKEGANEPEPIYRALLGVSIKEGDSELGEFLGDLGYTDYKVGSKSKVPSVRTFENTIIRNVLTEAMPSLTEMKQVYKNEYKDKDKAFKEEVKEATYVHDNTRLLVESLVTGIKSSVGDYSVTDSTGAVDKVATRYTQAMLGFRKVKPAVRSVASTKFFEQEGRHPDGESVEDLEKLVAISGAYTKAYGGLGGRSK